MESFCSCSRFYVASRTNDELLEYIHTISWTSWAVSCSSLVYNLPVLQNDQACLLIHIKTTPNEFWTNTNTRSNSIIWTTSPNRMWHLWLEDGSSGLLYQICISLVSGFWFDLPLFSNAQDYEKLSGLLPICSKTLAHCLWPTQARECVKQTTRRPVNISKTDYTLKKHDAYSLNYL